jgi:hypothetical protein
MQETQANEPAFYEIKVWGHLDERRARRFEGLTVTLLPDGVTVLAGPIVDQAALHGVLARVRDLGLPLLAVQRFALPQPQRS